MMIKLKTRLSILLISVFLVSCEHKDADFYENYQKAEYFYNNQLNDFLNDKELQVYNFNPRVKFVRNSGLANEYALFPDDKGLGIYCFTFSCTLTEPFLKIPLNIHKGKWILTKDSIISNIDSLGEKTYSFKSEPIKYYDYLTGKLQSFGIESYSREDANDDYKIYLSDRYLLERVNPKCTKFYGSQIIKTFPDNWVFLIENEN